MLQWGGAGTTGDNLNAFRNEERLRNHVESASTQLTLHAYSIKLITGSSQARGSFRYTVTCKNSVGNSNYSVEPSNWLGSSEWKRVSKVNCL
jgi:hypothetical protein